MMGEVSWWTISVLSLAILVSAVLVFMVRTDRQTDRQTDRITETRRRMITILTRLPSMWIIDRLFSRWLGTISQRLTCAQKLLILALPQRGPGLRRGQKRFQCNIISAGRLCWQQILHLRPEKLRYGTPQSKKWGYRYHAYPHKLHLCVYGGPCSLTGPIYAPEHEGGWQTWRRHWCLVALSWCNDYCCLLSLLLLLIKMLMTMMRWWWWCLF